MADQQPKETPKKPAKKGKGRKGGGAREEHAAAISNDICDIVKKYKIDGPDNVLPRINGLLRATTSLIGELVPNVREGHLTHSLANELFYGAMVLENEGKETLKNFMIKSANFSVFCFCNN